MMGASFFLVFVAAASSRGLIVLGRMRPHTDSYVFCEHHSCHLSVLLLSIAVTAIYLNGIIVCAIA